MPLLAVETVAGKPSAFSRTSAVARTKIVPPISSTCSETVPFWARDSTAVGALTAPTRVCVCLPEVDLSEKLIAPALLAALTASATSWVAVGVWVAAPDWAAPTKRSELLSAAVMKNEKGRSTAAL